MHWAVIPLLVTAVSAAAVDTEVETEAKRDGKRKKYQILCKFLSFFPLDHLRGYMTCTDYLKTKLQVFHK